MRNSTSPLEPTDSIWHPISQASNLERNPPLKIVSANGATLVDENGREFLDGMAGIWCVNVGYGREELAQVAFEQMKKLPYLSPTLKCEPTEALAAKLLKLSGMKGRVYFTCSGSEANEAAFKMVRKYHLQSGEEGGYNRTKIVSRYRAYHGNTMAALSATGQAERKIGYAMQLPDIKFIHPPYPYRRYEKFTPEEHAMRVAYELEETIMYEGAQTVAAFIMEPIISGGGVLVPPDNYIPEVRRICEKYGVLLIFDEVVSGFGRTGKMFGHQHWTSAPDIITCAKGIASGYQPLGATIVSERIYDAFRSDIADLKHYRHINTYGGHPVACAVALRNIEIIERENLADAARDTGAYMRKGFDKLLSHANVGEVRSKGMLFGIELVADKESKKALHPDLVGQVIGSAKAAGVLVGRNGDTIPGLANVLVLAPPLTLTIPEADKIVAAVSAGIHSL